MSRYKKRKKTEHTSLVTLSPIEYRHDDPDGRVQTISDTLEAEAKLAAKEYERGEESGKPKIHILRQCPAVHMARLQIIDNVIPEMGQQPPDSLKSKYLLFVAEVDGSIDDFLDALYNGPQNPFDWAKEAESRQAHANFVHNVWGQCIGYPEGPGCVFFRQYMHRCRIKVKLPFSAYNYTVAEINEARDIQVKFANFVEANQGLRKADLFKEWQAFVDEYDPFASTGHLSIKKKLFRGAPRRTSRETPDKTHMLASRSTDRPPVDRRQQ